MDVHIALGEEMERLFREWGTVRREDEDALSDRLAAVTSVILDIPARSLVGAILQLREVARCLRDDDMSAPTPERLYDAVLSALAAVEAVAGVERATYAGEEFVPVTVH